MKTVHITYADGVEVYVGSTRTLFPKGAEPKLSNANADALIAHGRARLVEDHHEESESDEVSAEGGLEQGGSDHG